MVESRASPESYVSVDLNPSAATPPGSRLYAPGIHRRFYGRRRFRQLASPAWST